MRIGMIYYRILAFGMLLCGLFFLAAAIAGAREMRLPVGFDSPVSERGLTGLLGLACLLAGVLGLRFPRSRGQLARR